MLDQRAGADQAERYEGMSCRGEMQLQKVLRQSSQEPIDRRVFLVLLNLLGHWLEQANFLIGQNTSVEVREGRLILTTQPSWTLL